MTITRTRHDDTMVTVTVQTESAIVDFNDILNATVVEPDHAKVLDKPWDRYDGFEHAEISIGYCPDYHLRRGYIHRQSHGRSDIIIELREDFTGLHQWYRDRGASKQVAAELVAQAKREAIDQLVKWYSRGWSWYTCHGEYKGYSSAYDARDSHQHALDTCMEVAMDIAYNMEQDGYTIVNYPAGLSRLARRLPLFSFSPLQVNNVPHTR